MADKYYGVGLSGTIDASSLDGYLAEDFAVFKRFTGGQTITDLGEITATYSSAKVVTFNVSSYVGADLTIDNFIVQFTAIQKVTTAYACTLTWTYNATTKVITCTSNNNLFASGTTKAKIYLIE